jgi:hypothetical protein
MQRAVDLFHTKNAIRYGSLGAFHTSTTAWMFSEATEEIWQCTPEAGQVLVHPGFLLTGHNLSFLRPASC